MCAYLSSEGEQETGKLQSRCATLSTAFYQYNAHFVLQGKMTSVISFVLKYDIMNCSHAVHAVLVKGSYQHLRYKPLISGCYKSTIKIQGGVNVAYRILDRVTYFYNLTNGSFYFILQESKAHALSIMQKWL